jgi:hypothetical protein
MLRADAGGVIILPGISAKEYRLRASTLTATSLLDHFADHHINIVAVACCWGGEALALFFYEPRRDESSQKNHKCLLWKDQTGERRLRIFTLPEILTLFV